MKYKGSAACGNSSAGRSHPVNRKDIPHKTGINKTDKNDSGGLRRSSRRATIERRVWAVPKKTTKQLSKEKFVPKPSAKEQEKKEEKPVEKPPEKQKETKASVRTTLSRGVKRGPVTPEEAGNARRKVKKKDISTKDTSNIEIDTDRTFNKADESRLGKNESERTITTPIKTHSNDSLEFECDSLRTENQLTELVESEDEIKSHVSEESLLEHEIKSHVSESLLKDESHVSEPHLKRGEDKSCVSETILEHKGCVSESFLKPEIKSCVSEPLLKHGGRVSEPLLQCGDSAKSERAVEETLLTDEFCLNSAIIEEVIPDFLSSSDVSQSTETDKDASVSSTVNVDADKLNTVEINKVKDPTEKTRSLGRPKKYFDFNSTKNSEKINLKNPGKRELSFTKPTKKFKFISRKSEGKIEDQHENSEKRNVGKKDVSLPETIFAGIFSENSQEAEEGLEFKGFENPEICAQNSDQTNVKETSCIKNCEIASSSQVTVNESIVSSTVSELESSADSETLLNIVGDKIDSEKSAVSAVSTVNHGNETKISDIEDKVSVVSLGNEAKVEVEDKVRVEDKVLVVSSVNQTKVEVKDKVSAVTPENKAKVENKIFAVSPVNQTKVEVEDRVIRVAKISVGEKEKQETIEAGMKEHVAILADSSEIKLKSAKEGRLMGMKDIKEREEEKLMGLINERSKEESKLESTKEKLTGMKHEKPKEGIKLKRSMKEKLIGINENRKEKLTGVKDQREMLTEVEESRNKEKLMGIKNESPTGVDNESHKELKDSPVYLGSGKEPQIKEKDLAGKEPEIEVKDLAGKEPEIEVKDLAGKEQQIKVKELGTGKEPQIEVKDLGAEKEPQIELNDLGTGKKPQIKVTDLGGKEPKNEITVAEDDHVSLSVALAQLLDGGGQTDCTETVTIHSASPTVQLKETQEVLALEVKDKVLNKPLIIDDDDEDDAEGELFIREDDDVDDDNVQSSAFDTDEDEELSISESKKSSPKPCILEGEIEKAASDVSAGLIDADNNNKDVERIGTSIASPSSPQQHKPKKQIPPLIKISSKPPAIKTPLKCPECPMQFCTVRSLLWHFGTHGARSQQNYLSPILLQDLIVPWDKPTVSLFLSPLPDEGKDKLLSPVESASSQISPAEKMAEKMSEIFEKMGEKMSKPESGTTLTPLRDHEPMGTNGDVILKVPIPRLKQPTKTVVKKDKFVNILPKIVGEQGQSGQLVQSVSPQMKTLRTSSSPTPKIRVSGKRDMASRKLKKSVQKITLRDNINSEHQVQIKPFVPVTSKSTVQIQPLINSGLQIQPNSGLQIQSNSGVQIQPLTSTGVQIQSLGQPLSSQSPVQIQPLSSTQPVQIQPLNPQVQIQPLSANSNIQNSKTSHIALIPMDNLTGQRGKLGGNSPLRMMSPPHSVKTSATSASVASPMDGMLEKDGLVMINSNLALRIVSSLPTTLDSDTSTTNTTTIRPIASLTNNLTILPQMEGSKFISSKESVKSPDILTIVPQIEKKPVSLLKPLAPSQVPVPQATPNSSASQVVKLLLLQPQDTKNMKTSDTVKISVASDPTNKLNGLEIPVALPIPNGNEKDMLCDEDLSDEDEGMVIDDKDGEDEVMDPLSLCAVTMEDENMETSASQNANETSTGQNASQTASQSGTNDDSSQAEKVAIRVKTKGKGHPGVDIVKYEARKYVCCYCNRRFGWSTDLKRHVILHTGEKPFECKVCPASFTRKFLLQNHMKRMHPDKCKMSDLWP